MGGHFECRLHPWESFCTCPAAFDVPIIQALNLKMGFIKSWTTRYIHNDEAFMYNSDVASATLFKVCTSETVEEFVMSHIDLPNMRGVWNPSSTKKALVNAFLAYQAFQARNGRSTCKIRQEASTKNYEQMMADGEMVVRSLKTGVQSASIRMISRTDQTIRYAAMSRWARRATRQHLLFMQRARTEGLGMT